MSAAQPLHGGGDLCIPCAEAGWVLPGSCSQWEVPMCCSFLKIPMHQKVLQEPSQAPRCFSSQSVS